PRFTRTSAMANIYAPVRAGSDIVFLGALIRYVLEKQAYLVGKKREEVTDLRDRFYFDYLTKYTNALTLVNKDYQDTEEERKGIWGGQRPQGRKPRPEGGGDPPGSPRAAHPGGAGAVPGARRQAGGADAAPGGPPRRPGGLLPGPPPPLQPLHARDGRGGLR